MKKAILCVDDEKMIVVSLIDQLRGHFGDKYLYEMAMSGEEALEVIEELVTESVTVILIISDYLMCGMRGDELLIRVQEKYPGTLNVVLTGQASAEAIEHIREEAGLNAYITKPWDREKLVNRINEILDEYEQ